MFHDLANTSRDENSCELISSPDNVLHGHDDSLMAGNRGFKIVSCKDELHNFRPIVLNRRYGIGIKTKAKKLFNSRKSFFFGLKHRKY